MNTTLGKSMTPEKSISPQKGTTHEEVARLREGGMNCAQAVAAYVLGRFGEADERMICAFRGLGSGLCTGHNCGCVVGGACAFGYLLPSQDAATKKQVRSLTTALVNWFEGRYGSIECAELKSPAQGRPRVPCDTLIEATCEACVDLLKAEGLTPV